MTTIAPPTAEPLAGGLTDIHVPGLARARARTRDAAWALPATAGVLVFAAVLYFWNLTVSGYANVYYSATAWAASQSWSAWFFGSIDPANFITVDKPPLATMVMGLSVRLFGLSSASILVPEALMGVATVALLMATVRRTFGPAASIIAGLVAALTPAAILIFRYNNPDALLTLLSVGAAYAFVRALESDRIRWLALAGVLVGLGFETKLLQAFLILPAFAITYVIAGPGTVRRRIAGLVVSLVAVTVSSAWWVGAMELIPAASRAYVGGSTNNSALDLVLGYDGLGRIFGEGGGGGGAGGAGQGGGGFSGTPGLLRLFNAQLGGQVFWLLPMAAVGLVAGLVARVRAGRTDLARAAFLMWGLWLAVHVVVFSFMSGVIHSYYVVMMAPAVGALVGGGVVALWRARERHPWAGVLLGLVILGSAVVALLILDRTPSFAPGLGIGVVVVASLVLPVLALPVVARRRLGAGRQVVAVRPGSTGLDRIHLAVAVLGLAALLVGPAAYAFDSVATAYSGGDPSAGPQSADSRGGPGGNGGFGGAPNGSANLAPGGTGIAGGPASGGQAPGALGGFAGGAGFGGQGGSLDAATIDYLVANQGSARWIVAVSGANSAGQIELSTGKPVMAMGGFTGSDNAPTLTELQALIASGDLRFVSVGGGGAGGPNGGSSSVSSWVSSACQAVSVGGTTSSVYDCAGAVTG
jgi:4-amino-4-deoxy-L-arabinose transferase-like glycosyltransferase